MDEKILQRPTPATAPSTYDLRMAIVEMCRAVGAVRFTRRQYIDYCRAKWPTLVRRKADTALDNAMVCRLCFRISVGVYQLFDSVAKKVL